ncbi:TSUP family transporter [Litorivicinus lipolyticus]|uniref:Probable membrane transporter protein n=1 Tax=Litorivicinus lipolyticus TaxID=418701 RepID=A0A5Q2QEB6_9GAMM|nr:sulfite exporter TauE/SafE family protein [Litorivicinus lipolyticus]QGG80672.1 TSUP family transporter [Litorivicinus lipolyticus]
MPLDSTTLLIASIAALFVGLSKGGLPTVAMLSVPVLSLVVSPLKGAALLLPIYIATDCVGVWLYRRRFSTTNLKILIPSGFFGIAIGYSTAHWVSDAVVSLLIGVMGLTFVAYNWAKRSQVPMAKPANRRAGVGWGTVMGFTSFISHTGGPPFQMYVLPQKLDKLTFAGTSTLTFAAINLAKLPPYMALQPYSADDLWLAVWLLPTGLAGTFLGAYLTRKINEQVFFAAVEIGLGLVSCKLIYDVLSA